MIQTAPFESSFVIFTNVIDDQVSLFDDVCINMCAHAEATWPENSISIQNKRKIKSDATECTMTFAACDDALEAFLVGAYHPFDESVILLFPTCGSFTLLSLSAFDLITKEGKGLAGH